jgi:Bacterial Ig-like domain (group 3)
MPAAHAATSFTLTGEQTCSSAGVPSVTWTISFQSDTGQQLMTGQSARTDVVHADGTTATISGPSAFFFLQLNPGQTKSGTTAAALGDVLTETITASFQPEGGLQSTQATVRVTKCATTTDLKVSPGSIATIDTPVTYTATVGPTPNGGTVSFTDHGVTVPGCGAVAVSPTTGVATCTTTYTVPGSHRVTATYSGTSVWGASTSSPVSVRVTTPLPPPPPSPVATTTVVTATPGPTTTAGTPVTYSATVGPHPSGGTVTFTEGGNPISGCTTVPVNTTTGVATCTVTYGAPGTHDVTATFSGSPGFIRSTSSPYTLTVSAVAPQPPTTPPATPATPAVDSGDSSPDAVLALTGIQAVPLIGLGLLLLLAGTGLLGFGQPHRRPEEG